MSRAIALHGLTGAPASVEGVAEALREAGFVVDVPSLPGHGTRVEDLDDKRWSDWLGAAEDALARAAPGRVLLFGLSMGGSLACRLAADHPDRVARIATVNPFIDPPAESFREAVRGVIAAGFPRGPGIAGDIADPSVTEPGYDELPLEALLSLCEGLDDLLERLPQVTCPLLIFTSTQDHVIPPVSSDVLAERVSGPVERVVLERSYHVATLDHDRAEIEKRTVEFALRSAADG